ncbi:MAG: methyltransferase domain-containing protein [Burkholderiales bacterium]
MNIGRCICWCLLLAASAAHAQAPAETYKPIAGQPGKDVVWIPTPDITLEKMLDMARLAPSDYVIDLGSGDGRMVIAAARRGARAHGVEFNPDLVALSQRAAAAAGVADKATFSQGDMFEADISKATVMPLFLLPNHLSTLAPKFLMLKPGARIVSNTYEIGGGWEPDETVRTTPCNSWCIAILYIVPAPVAGTWRLSDGTWLLIEQYFQKFSGAYQIEGVSVPIENGKLRGTEISFTVNQVQYSGHIKGDTMQGVAQGRVKRDWRAVLVRE